MAKENKMLKFAMLDPDSDVNSLFWPDLARLLLLVSCLLVISSCGGCVGGSVHGGSDRGSSVCGGSVSAS